MRGIFEWDDLIESLNHLKMVPLDSTAISETKNSNLSSTFPCFMRIPMGCLAV